MEQEKEKLIFIDTDEEWDRKFRNLQARYDSRHDDKRRPSKASLILVVGLVGGMVAAGLAALPHIF